MRNRNYNKCKKNAYESLTMSQRAAIIENLDSMKRLDIAKLIKVSETKLKRAAAYAGWKFTYTQGFVTQRYTESKKEEVWEFYRKHGRKKTQEAFPDIKVRSIIERYGKGEKPRQRRWEPSELVELVKMAGFVSPKKQVEYFNRPNAGEMSIRKAWQRVFGARPMRIHGLPHWKAKYFVTEECPRIWPIVHGGPYIYLWIDCKDHLRDDCPDFIKKAVEALAKFQVSILGKNPRREIEKIIKERS